MKSPTDRQALIQARLPASYGDLRDHVIAERIRGKSWRTIARAIEDITGIQASHVTLADWYSADEETARTKAAERIKGGEAT